MARRIHEITVALQHFTYYLVDFGITELLVFVETYAVLMPKQFDMKCCNTDKPKKQSWLEMVQTDKPLCTLWVVIKLESKWESEGNHIETYLRALADPSNCYPSELTASSHHFDNSRSI